MMQTVLGVQQYDKTLRRPLFGGTLEDLEELITLVKHLRSKYPAMQ